MAETDFEKTDREMDWHRDRLREQSARVSTPMAELGGTAVGWGFVLAMVVLVAIVLVEVFLGPYWPGS